ncbi:MAG: hypothetical protein CM1200mP35_08140 [Chloroflexota bacterium]|nr:MAG: hypothetical protein CM1200mP35_08140 [Chloroflexota bacterium]
MRGKVDYGTNIYDSTWETVWNLEGRIQGHTDIDLSPYGRSQARPCPTDCQMFILMLFTAVISLVPEKLQKSSSAKSLMSIQLNA